MWKLGSHLLIKHVRQSHVGALQGSLFLHTTATYRQDRHCCRLQSLRKSNRCRFVKRFGRLLDMIDRFIRVHQKTSFEELDETRTDTQL